MSKRLFFVCFMIFLLGSCSTTLKMNVVRPAKLNLNGAKSIGVVPFEQSSRFPFYSSGIGDGFSEFDSYLRVNSVERQVLNFIRYELEQGIMKSPYVELINGDAVKKSLNGQDGNAADVYISGEMVTFNIFDELKVLKKEMEPEGYLHAENVDVGYEGASSYNGDVNKASAKTDSAKHDVVKTADGDVAVDIEEFYTREVILVFNYQVVEGKSNKVLYFDTLKIDQRCQPVRAIKELPEPFSMISSDLDDFISDFMKVLQPYDLTRSVTLLGDDSKNPDMEMGLKMAGDGKLKECYEVFYNIYNNDGIFEAGYNAAMVLMVLGDLQGAEELMSMIYSETKNVKAGSGLADILNEIRQKQIFEEQTGAGER